MWVCGQCLVCHVSHTVVYSTFIRKTRRVWGVGWSLVCHVLHTVVENNFFPTREKTILSFGLSCSPYYCLGFLYPKQREENIVDRFLDEAMVVILITQGF